MNSALSFAAALLTAFLTVLSTPAAHAAEEAGEAPELPLMDAAEVTLSQFKWENRLIVVFADSPLDPRFKEQMSYLRGDVPALLIRDVVVVTDTSPEAESPLRQELHPRDFALVLIGKDGQVKLRKPVPWDMREISRSIDKWPIRQQEIREELGKE
ncbi:MAG: DUF4174 domain-containing protein [Sediminimonas qiaohouensis]|uniref:DUF4174 domain-containing protein n=1 Tax=Sediminimonas qiaohouensis TaxID=552061 RepID=A0A7C9L6G7_9RHOB|nr:DUF4174 domain-containing protein [Sediminimonas qiaohouensis]MTJ03315.1 DUF4174 domain-containing protein [Sediminimonas qiaohouensis]